MADDTDTPPATAKPTTTRRRAARPNSTAPTSTAKPARKPATKKPVTVAEAADKPKRAATSPKPRTTKRATTAKPRAAAKPRSKTTAATKKTADKPGRSWGKTAIAGGIAVIGAAATAALLTLRGSSAKDSGGAHMPDGADATASFKAGIADENVIPEKA